MRRDGGEDATLARPSFAERGGDASSARRGARVRLLSLSPAISLSLTPSQLSSTSYTRPTAPRLFTQPLFSRSPTSSSLQPLTSRPSPLRLQSCRVNLAARCYSRLSSSVTRGESHSLSSYWTTVISHPPTPLEPSSADPPHLSRAVGWARLR